MHGQQNIKYFKLFLEQKPLANDIHLSEECVFKCDLVIAFCYYILHLQDIHFFILNKIPLFRA